LARLLELVLEDQAFVVAVVAVHAVESRVEREGPGVTGGLLRTNGLVRAFDEIAGDGGCG
jgi:hypothetical protein